MKKRIARKSIWDKFLESNYARKISPLFWKRCHICGADFKGRFGWLYKRSMIGFDGSYDDKYYICGDCAKTKELAEEIIRARLSL